MVRTDGRIGRASGDAETPRRGLRLRNQAEHFAAARGPPLRSVRRPGANLRRGRSGDEAGRSLSFERAGRSGAGHLRGREYSEAHGPRAGLRHLPGASVVRPGAGRENLQAEIRASRFESSGKKSADGTSGNYRAESRILRRSGIAAVKQSRNHAHQFKRRHERGHAPQVAAALQRAVSPGSLARSARFALSVHTVHRHDERIRAAGQFPALTKVSREIMPKRKDIKKILIIGSGPIVIGQACEFDYSGAQACKALRAEGYKVILVNSNPATIMTDPELANRTYIEPLTKEYLEEIIAKEKPDALLPTVGGQTALNLAVELSEGGILEKYKVEMIGASLRAIKVAEDRLWFKDACRKIGLEVPASALVNNAQDALRLCDQLGFPLVIRPSFTLGGTGGSIAYNKEEFGEAIAHALDMSPVHEALVEEYELEVMRDFRDNFVVICTIENFDPMGVHTGDSITVAPAQTLTDKEFQRMRDAAAAIIREVGVETGGSNVQFAVNPENGRMVVIEMNPRVSRSSALASKATGFPIAKIAARLAVGMSLDEIPNDITKKTPACFQPTIDYVVVKIPKWQFEKFPGADSTLGTQMKSVGEVMAIGRTFKESLQKAIRSLEPSTPWRAPAETPDSLLREKLATPRPDRIHWLLTAVERGLPAAEICDLTKIDPWFIHQIEEINQVHRRAASVTVETASKDLLREVKRVGTSDEQLAQIWKTTPAVVRLQRARYGVAPVFKRVDTCSAEFESFTPYMYSTYEDEDESDAQPRPKIMILGSGPNRIGQGIEFDYCCCHASFALHEDGYETIMVNCNPETVSTDYDTSDRLYFEPLTLEDVLAIVEREKPQGVVVQFGGQTPLNLALELKRNGVPIIGTTPESIDLAEDRRRFGRLLEELKIPQPKNGTALVPEEAARVAAEIGFPVLVRPSYVLGGRAMVIAYDLNTVQEYVAQAALMGPARPVLIDQFLEAATEVDVDALADGSDVVIAGIMEHIEEAGVHSGDSSCVLPPVSLSPSVLARIRDR